MTITLTNPLEDIATVAAGLILIANGSIPVRRRSVIAAQRTSCGAARHPRAAPFYASSFTLLTARSKVGFTQ